MKYRIIFLVITCVMGIISALLHEFGHVVFYWMQGIPAGMSLVMEFPLIDISKEQYSIGSSGGPLVNILLIFLAYYLTTKYEKKSKPWTLSSAMVVANSFYLIFRALLGWAKNDGGEIEYVMNLIGLNFSFAALGFLTIAILILALWVKNSRIKISIWNSSYYVIVFVSYLTIISVMESIDAKYFWGNYPTVTIEDVRVHNPKQ